MAEEFCQVGEINLCYETFGDPGDPALLLIMGLATQMIAWHEDFCAELVRRGFFVIRFDNRDIGRSSKIEGRPPTMAQILTRSRKAGRYTLDDMAGDAVGLLDHLGIERAHVVGASMGGMIAQTVAARHPGRVLSLASIMSNTGSRFTGQPKLAIYPVILRTAPSDREAFVEHIASVYRAIGSPGFDRDLDEIRELAERSYERGINPAGSARQLGAIVASGNRTSQVARIEAPTVVIHGTSDRLVSPSGGRATARAIRGAKLVMVEGMGHDLPRGAWPQIIEAIVENAARAESPVEAQAA